MDNKSKDFLADIGLDFWTKQLEAAYAPIPEKSTLVSFFSPTSVRMDCPRMASYTHIQNLIRTYGKDIVLEAISMAMNEDK